MLKRLRNAFTVRRVASVTAVLAGGAAAAWYFGRRVMAEAENFGRELERQLKEEYQQMMIQQKRYACGHQDPGEG